MLPVRGRKSLSRFGIHAHKCWRQAWRWRRKWQWCMFTPTSLGCTLADLHVLSISASVYRRRHTTTARYGQKLKHGTHISEWASAYTSFGSCFLYVAPLYGKRNKILLTILILFPVVIKPSISYDFQSNLLFLLAI